MKEWKAGKAGQKQPATRHSRTKWSMVEVPGKIRKSPCVHVERLKTVTGKPLWARFVGFMAGRKWSPPQQGVNGWSKQVASRDDFTARGFPRVALAFNEDSRGSLLWRAGRTTYARASRPRNAPRTLIRRGDLSPLVRCSHCQDQVYLAVQKITGNWASKSCPLQFEKSFGRTTNKEKALPAA